VEDSEWDEGGRNYREHLERSRAEGFNPLKFGVTGRISYKLTPPWCGENFRVSVPTEMVKLICLVHCSCQESNLVW
jgi:hypothetical protein